MMRPMKRTTSVTVAPGPGVSPLRSDRSGSPPLSSAAPSPAPSPTADLPADGGQFRQPTVPQHRRPPQAPSRARSSTSASPRSPFSPEKRQQQPLHLSQRPIRAHHSPSQSISSLPDQFADTHTAGMPHRPRRVHHSPSASLGSASDFNLGASTRSQTRIFGTQGRPSAGAMKANVRVMVRVRPFSEAEISLVHQQGGYLQSVIDAVRSDQVQVLDHERNYAPKQAFNFDAVLWSVTQQASPIGFHDQSDVYDQTGSQALEALWDGINSCIFAYGQTGSGKTYTMMGDPAQIAAEGGCDDEKLGLIPRLCRQLFEDRAEREAEAQEAELQRSVAVEVVFIEIYNEAVKDLLVGSPIDSVVRDGKRQTKRRGDGKRDSDGRPINAADLFRRMSVPSKDVQPAQQSNHLQVREHPIDGPQVAGVTVSLPQSYDDIMTLINFGNRERSVAATKLNDRSSRSHAMFRITLRQVTHVEKSRAGIGGPQVDTYERHARINLVDLAGSENTKRSGASGATMVEAQKINVSLTTLRRVIDALIEQKPAATVPYRDSTLTWLLRQDLGGNSKCFMLATVSPHHVNSHESVRTLEYAMRARAIVNQVRVNEDDISKVLMEMEARFAEKQRQMLSGELPPEVREALQRELEEALNNRNDLQAHVDYIAARQAEVEEEANRERKERTRSKFRHAVLRVARQRQLDDLNKTIDQRETELQEQRRRMRECGFESVEEMIANLEKGRGELDTLCTNADSVAKQVDTIEQRGRELMQKYDQEKLDLQRQIDALLDQQAQRNSPAMRELQPPAEDRPKQLAALYERQMEQAEATHRQRLQIARDDERKAMLQAAQDFEERRRSQEESMRNHIKSTRHEIVQIRQQSFVEMRAVQEAEMALHAELNEARREAERATVAGAGLSNTVKASNRQLAEELHAAQSRTQELRSRLNQTRTEAEFAAVQRRQERDRLGAEVAAAARARDAVAGDISRLIIVWNEDEERWAKAHASASEFISVLGPTGDIPSHWTMGDARAAVRAYSRRRHAVASVRPRACSPPAALRLLSGDDPPPELRTQGIEHTPAAGSHAAPADPTETSAGAPITPPGQRRPRRSRSSMRAPGSQHELPARHGGSPARAKGSYYSCADQPLPPCHRKYRSGTPPAPARLASASPLARAGRDRRNSSPGRRAVLFPGPQCRQPSPRPERASSASAGRSRSTTQRHSGPQLVSAGPHQAGTPNGVTHWSASPLALPAKGNLYSPGPSSARPSARRRPYRPSVEGVAPVGIGQQLSARRSATDSTTTAARRWPSDATRPLPAE